MRSSLFIVLAALAVLIAHPGLYSADVEETVSAPFDIADAWIDSAGTVRSLTDGLVALYNEGETEKMKILIEQLARKHCELSLSKTLKDKKPPSEIYKQYKKSVLIIGTLFKCSKCAKWHVSVASGFFLTKSGVMVTNYHVVDHPTHMAMGAMTHDGKIYAVKEVLAAHKGNDIAILQLQASGVTPLSLSPGNPVGSPVSVISHPGKQFYTLTQGIISGYFIQDKYRMKISRMSITADFGVGSSGAPIFNEYGGVVGIVAATRPIFAHKKCEHEHTQMVIKNCIPAESILNLVRDKIR